VEESERPMPWHSPWFGTLHLPNGGLSSQLTTLLRAKDAQQFTPSEVIRFLWCTVQADDDFGAGNLWIGNSNVSSTEWGWHLVATQTASIPASESNLLVANDIWFITDIDNVDIHVSFLTR
jgi:hypothetical protein